MKCFLMILFMLPLPLLSAWSDYTPVSFDELHAEILAVISEEHAAGGVTIFTKRCYTTITLPKYPENTYETDKAMIEMFSKIFKSAEIFNQIYHKSVTVEYKGIAYCFYFQDKVAPYLEKENKTGKSIGIYCFLGIYNPVDKKIIIFVNEFK
jgi:hypothetical protein